MSSKFPCTCHHVETYMRGDSLQTKTVCWGTKEREECTCGGDVTKCNFYDNKSHETDTDRAIQILTHCSDYITVSSDNEVLIGHLLLNAIEFAVENLNRTKSKG